MKFLRSPKREFWVIALVALALAADYFLPVSPWVLFVFAVVGSLPVFWEAILSIKNVNITIDTFNAFVLGVSFATKEIRSAAFIVLMLAFASLLEWRTAARSRRAVEELLRLRPQKAVRENPDGRTVTIQASEVKKGDLLVVAPGERIPADGTVVQGRTLVNEAPVTGESVPVQKSPGANIISGTLNESGVFKLRVVRAGAESTLERMAALVKQASKNKSHAEKLADRFASVFLPVVLGGGLLTYMVTRNLAMTAAFFLVACADDMAVAIPLAITASIGRAAKHGIVVKGGEWLDAVGRVNIVVLDKTGTLTHGDFAFREAKLARGANEEKFWKLLGAAEKFSGHPVGRALFKEAQKRVRDIPDVERAENFEGAGIEAWVGQSRVAVGNEKLSQFIHVPEQGVGQKITEMEREYGGTTVAVFINSVLEGIVSVSDIPRPEARRSIEAMRREGAEKIFMFTGDRREVAAQVAESLGLDSYRNSMTPEEKFHELEILTMKGKVAMVGDGINDAPALARADVGIAMGQGGTAVAVETADIVILTDNLTRVPELMALGRKTTSVIRWDMGIWAVSNVVGFALVWTGVIGPAMAAFYNFATDFLPLVNSTRLFRFKEKYAQK